MKDDRNIDNERAERFRDTDCYICASDYVSLLSFYLASTTWTSFQTPQNTSKQLNVITPMISSLSALAQYMN